MDSMKEVVRGIRDTRISMQVPQNRKTNVFIVASDEKDARMYEASRSFGNLAFAKEFHVQNDKTGIGTDAVSIVVSNAVVYLPLEDLVDREKETERLEKEKERLSKEIARCEGMLNNPGFVNKAPEQKVAAEKAKLEKYKEMREKVLAQLSHLA